MKKLCSGVQYWKIVFAYTLVFYLLYATGCNGPALSSAEQVREFEKAGPLTPEVDVSRLIKAKIHTGPYRVVSGDILELQMPAILRVISSDLPDSLQKVEPYLCRVSDAGTITLPIVGDVPCHFEPRNRLGGHHSTVDKSLADEFIDGLITPVLKRNIG